MDVAAGWHEDPTGRHQVRWWDGSRWTDWVADNGQTARDPLHAGSGADSSTDTSPGEATLPAVAGTTATPTFTATGSVPDAGAVEHLLSQRRLAFECGGSSFSPQGWRNVFDEAGTVVGRIDRRERSLRLCDPAGAPFLDIEAHLIRGSGARRITGVSVSSNGQHLADVNYVQMRDITFTAKSGGAKVLVARFALTMSGAVTGASVELPDGLIVATIAQNDQRTPGMVGTMWLMLDKDPGLTDPYRLLTVTMPLVFDVFSHQVGKD